MSRASSVTNEKGIISSVYRKNFRDDQSAAVVCAFNTIQHNLEREKHKLQNGNGLI